MAKRNESKTAGTPKSKKVAGKKVAGKKDAPKKTAPKKDEGKKKASAKKAGVKKAGVKKMAGGGSAKPVAGAPRPFNMPASPEEVKYSDGELAMLREKQLELAMDGDRQMLIWLGKAVLGQTPAAARGGRAGEGDGNVIVLTPEEAAALYGGKGG